MALIADLLIAAALLAAVVIGARRGLLRSLTGLIVVVLAFVLASWAADRLADPVAQKLSPLVERRIEQKLTRQESASAESVLADFGFIGERLQELTQQVVHAAQESGASLLAALSQSVAHSVAYTLVYVVSFVLLLLVLGLLSKPLQLVTKLPVIHGANAIGGGALGLVWGALVVFVAVWALRKFDILLTPETVEQSRLLRFFAEHSPLDWISGL